MPRRLDDATPLSDPEAPLILFTTSGTTRSPKLRDPCRSARSPLHALPAAQAYGFDRSGRELCITAMPFCGVFGLDTACSPAITGCGTRPHGARCSISPMRLQRIHRHRDHLSVRQRRDVPAPDRSRHFGKLGFRPAVRLRVVHAWSRRIPAEVGGRSRDCRCAGFTARARSNALFAFQPLRNRSRSGCRAADGRRQASRHGIRVRDTDTGRLLGRSRPASWRSGPDQLRRLFPQSRGDARPSMRTAISGPAISAICARTARSSFWPAAGMRSVYQASWSIRPRSRTSSGRSPASAMPRSSASRSTARSGAAAFVIPSDRRAAFDEPAIIAAAASVLAAFKVPVRAFPLEAFPTTESANGLKIQKAKLRQMAADRL